jgi:regulator of protease activity HflC (stomatin/prohibitin superfamily)
MGCRIVKENTIVAQEHLGKFVGFLEPGLHFFNPLFYSTREALSFHAQAIDFPVETITRESLSVTIDVGVQYHIDDGVPLESVVVDAAADGDEDGAVSPLIAARNKRLYQTYYGVANPHHQMEQYVMGYFRTFAAQHSLAELLLEQKNMSQNLCVMLNEQMNRFGYVITQCVVTDINPPKEIKVAMNNVQSSQAEQRAMINKAEGRKRAMILEAEALSEVKRLEGEGLSLQRQALADGLKETRRKFGCGDEAMDPDALTRFIMVTQYTDMLSHAAQKGGNSFILSSNPLGAVTLDEQLKSSFLATREPAVKPV